MKKIKLSTSATRKIILNAQLLSGQNNLPAGKAGVAEIIDKLGYIQIDTISVINRAHHHSLWVRRPDYDEKMLHDLQAKDRRVFEYWGHAMAYLPMRDYRFFLPKMKNFENPSGNWARDRLDKYGKLMPSVLKRIREEGPLSAKDFEAPKGRKGGTWWDWKPAKMALELLFWQGKLMITERRKFQKYYDLRERVLPDKIDTSLPDEKEIGRFLVRRALSALGVANEREILNFMQPGTARDSDMQVAGKSVLHNSLNELIEAQEVTPIEIEGQSAQNYFAATRYLEKSTTENTGPANIHFLSPFDNLIIQRDRTKRLFGFDYTLECYVPAPKRKYGYFVLPVLWGENFVARFDAKADRKLKKLLIRNLFFEPGFERFDSFLPRFAKKMGEFAHFNDCEGIVVEEVQPRKMQSKFRDVLQKK
ncbi:MAG: winged helix-turn-helix domain-containing protein [Calditrichaeota bacterium]|nr:MAG: winged helix-turn-helix domain-containing protein [Calditrichota bacterium]